MKYYKFRRGNVYHFEKRSERNRTWTVCGKSRITHQLLDEPEKVVMDNLSTCCHLCMLGMTEKAFKAYEMDALVSAIEHDPIFQERFLRESMEKIEDLIEDTKQL